MAAASEFFSLAHRSFICHMARAIAVILLLRDFLCDTEERLRSCVVCQFIPAMPHVGTCSGLGLFSTFLHDVRVLTSIVNNTLLSFLFFYFIRIEIFRPGRNFLIFLPIWGWNFSWLFLDYREAGMSYFFTEIDFIVFYRSSTCKKIFWKISASGTSFSLPRSRF